MPTLQDYMGVSWIQNPSLGLLNRSSISWIKETLNLLKTLLYGRLKLHPQVKRILIFSNSLHRFLKICISLSEFQIHVHCTH